MGGDSKQEVDWDNVLRRGAYLVGGGFVVGCGISFLSSASNPSAKFSVISWPVLFSTGVGFGLACVNFENEYWQKNQRGFVTFENPSAKAGKNISRSKASSSEEVCKPAAPAPESPADTRTAASTTARTTIVLPTSTDATTALPNAPATSKSPSVTIESAVPAKPASTPKEFTHSPTKSAPSPTESDSPPTKSTPSSAKSIPPTLPRSVLGPASAPPQVQTAPSQMESDTPVMKSEARPTQSTSPPMQSAPSLKTPVTLPLPQMEPASAPIKSATPPMESEHTPTKSTPPAMQSAPPPNKTASLPVQSAPTPTISMSPPAKSNPSPNKYATKQVKPASGSPKKKDPNDSEYSLLVD